VSATEAVAVATGSLALALGATPVAARLASRLGVVDQPGALKPHTRATPYGGGIGVAAGVAVGVVVSHAWLAVPFAMALALGVADDVRPLSPTLRLAGQLATGAALATVEHSRFSGAPEAVLVVVATVVLINGYNLIDGLDALCGSVAMVSAVGFAVLLSGEGRLLALALAAAVGGFLAFNLAPAKVYLGDGGAYLVGTAMAALLVTAWSRAAHLSTGLGALVLVSLPATELCCAVLRRAKAHRSVLAGDRDHPYDQLVRHGWSTWAAVTAYAVVAILLAGVAVAAGLLSAPIAGLLVALAAVGLLTFCVRAGFLSIANTQSSDDAPDPR
jgi:UDP-GlcNAc:undecaprenyl-phosphate GlcNAc-1-phosphate transferase